MIFWNSDMRGTYKPSFHRREYKRFIVNGSANLIINGSLHKPLIIKNLSSRGACTFSDYPFVPKGKVKIVMIIPFLKKPVTIEAKVIWSRKIEEGFWETGLDFGINNLLELA